MFFPSLPFMRVMLFPSSWLGNAPRGGGGGGGGASFPPHSLFSSLPSSLSSIPLLLSFHFSLLSASTAFSSASSSFSLLCPHLFFLFSSFLSSFHYVFVLVLPYPSLYFFFFINRFLLCPHLFLFEGISCTVCFLRCNRGHH